MSEPAGRRRSQGGNCKNKNRLPGFFLQKANDIGRFGDGFLSDGEDVRRREENVL
jgi:hypothetical protein